MLDQEPKFSAFHKLFEANFIRFLPTCSTTQSSCQIVLRRVDIQASLENGVSDYQTQHIFVLHLEVQRRRKKKKVLTQKSVVQLHRFKFS